MVSARPNILAVMTRHSANGMPADLSIFHGHFLTLQRLRLGLLALGIEMDFAVHPDVPGMGTEASTARVHLIEDDRALEAVLQKESPDHILVWNGLRAPEFCADIKARGIGMIFCELGWFPQGRAIFLDMDGVAGKSSIRAFTLPDEPPGRAFLDWKSGYMNGLETSPCDTGEYVFVPLQLESDSNIRLFSPFAKMRDFIADVASRLPGQRIVVRPHPLCPSPETVVLPGVEYRADGNLHQWLAHAKAVVGINSTVLIEAMLYERPIFSYGVGIASDTGIYSDPATLSPATLDQPISADARRKRDNFLQELVEHRQILHEDFLNPDILRRNRVLSSILERHGVGNDPLLAIYAREFAQFDRRFKAVTEANRYFTGEMAKQKAVVLTMQRRMRETAATLQRWADGVENDDAEIIGVDFGPNPIQAPAKHACQDAFVHIWIMASGLTPDCVIHIDGTPTATTVDNGVATATLRFDTLNGTGEITATIQDSRTGQRSAPMRFTISWE